MIRFQTLGTLEVTMNGAEAPAQLLWKKNVALLLYLARAPKRRCTREQLIGLLWPDKDDAAARQSVREAIRMVQHHVGAARLKKAGDVIQLVDGAVELDTDRFEQLAQQRAWTQITPLINGKYLDGFKISDASGFEDWLTIERSHWNSRSLEALLNHAEACLDVGDELAADAPLLKAREIDPLSQRGLRCVMRRLAVGDDRSGALRLVDEFHETLEPETNTLIERLRSGRAWRLPNEALSPQASVTWRRAPLLERKRELEAALAQWREIRRSGRVRLLVVTADAGGGKTRFVEELVTRATLDGATIAATRAVPADLEQPGSTLIGLARGRLVDAPGVAGANPAALATLGAQVGEWAERFPRRDSSTWTVGAALVEVLRVASAERATVLIFDDAQWIDAASYQFIEQLTRDLPRARLLIVLATTPEPAPPKLAELRARIGRDIAGAVVTFSAFTHAAIAELIRWALPSYAGDAADRLARRIAADSGGVPLLAVEMCQAMARGLDIESLSGSWPHPLRTLDSTFPGDLPDTIVASIRVEFRCLTRPAQQALVATAVLGERVASRQIAAASGLAGESLQAALDELEWRRWLVAESRGYAFVARIVRDVIARDMVKEGERQRILDAAKHAT